MPDSGTVSQRNQGVTLRRGAKGIAYLSCLLLLAVSCPNEFTPLPPSLKAPKLATMELSAVRTGSGAALQYHPAVRITWTAPDQDSVRVQYYSLLRSAVSGTDTAFTVVTHSIPAGVTETYDRIDRIIPPKELHQKRIFYRIVAIDSLDRPGDTSAVDTFVLAHPAQLTSPRDTLFINLFRWTVAKVPAGYREQMTLWGDNGAVWESPLPLTPTYGSTEWYITNQVSLPDHLWPLPSGSVYYFSVRVIEESPLPTQSIAISEPLYVP